MPGPQKSQAKLGFIEWNPQPKTRVLITAVKDVLAQYSAHLPLTIRQIFYRLVATGRIDKTDKEYQKLVTNIGFARRARMISFDAIRDDSLTEQVAHSYPDRRAFRKQVEFQAKRFRLDRQFDQPMQHLIYCEAAGMVPQLAAAVEEWGIPVLSDGGFDAITNKHALAQRILDSGEPLTRVLHIGDHDPSGGSIFSSLRDDVTKFCSDMDGDPDCVQFERIAITPDQVLQMGLPMNRRNPDDKRAFEGIGGDPDATAQAEAMPRDALREVVRQAVLQEWDNNAYKEVLKQEEMNRQHLIAAVRRLLD